MPRMVRQAPKRAIYRNHSAVSASLTTAEVTDTLISVTRGMTLVRAVVDLTGITPGATLTWGGLLQVVPSGSSGRSPDISEALNQDENFYTLFRWMKPVHGSSVEGVNVHVDLKSMRKVREGDSISLNQDLSGSTLTVTGTVTLFFKET